MKKFIYTFIILAFATFNFNTTVMAAPVSAPVKPAAVNSPIKQQAQTVQAQTVSPLSLVENPNAYLNKTVTFSGEFVSFTSLGLDYKPAFREGSKYIGVLIKRPDVKDHTIPLSELKMFMTREMAEKNIEIETGDKFKLTGKIFAVAIGDPWLDITSFKITEKVNKAEQKK